MSEEESVKTQPLFRDIAADDDDPEITEIESFCVNCEDQVRLKKKRKKDRKKKIEDFVISILIPEGNSYCRL